VPRRIVYDFPFRAIIFDIDGTTTGKGPESWATFYYKHNDWMGCDYLPDMYDGQVCDSRVKIRKLSFYNMAPSHRF